MSSLALRRAMVAPALRGYWIAAALALAAIVLLLLLLLLLLLVVAPTKAALAGAGFAFVGAAVTRAVDVASERRTAAAKADAAATWTRRGDSHTR